MNKYKFYKEIDNRWYIDLPDYPGEKKDLEMVYGADTMLDIISNNSTSADLVISDEFFEGSDTLTLLRKADDMGEGGWYLLEYYNGCPHHIEMWLCGVTEFVFGYLPDKIYIK